MLVAAEKARSFPTEKVKQVWLKNPNLPRGNKAKMGKLVA